MALARDAMSERCETDLQDMTHDLEAFIKSDTAAGFADLDYVDLNVVLHRADGEERDAMGGDGTYAIPNYGSLVYCGLEGFMQPLRQIAEKNDLGHPLCAHLREGTWAMDYIVNRLEK